MESLWSSRHRKKIPRYIFQNSPRELEKLFLLAKQASCFQWDDEDDDNDDGFFI